MKKVVLDTSVIIEFTRGRGEDLKQYLKKQEQGELVLFVPTVVIFKFFSGTSLKNKQIQEKSDLLFSKFKVVQLNQEIAHLAAELNRKYLLYKQVGAVDLLIAATAISLSAKLATENKKDFQKIEDLQLID